MRITKSFLLLLKSDESRDCKIDGDQDEEEDMFSSLVDLLPLLGPPHGDGDPAVGEQVEELVLAGELPVGGGVRAAVEAEEANQVQGDRVKCVKC